MRSALFEGVHGRDLERTLLREVSGIVINSCWAFSLKQKPNTFTHRLVCSFSIIRLVATDLVTNGQILNIGSDAYYCSGHTVA